MKRSALVVFLSVVLAGCAYQPWNPYGDDPERDQARDEPEEQEAEVAAQEG